MCRTFIKPGYLVFELIKEDNPMAKRKLLKKFSEYQLVGGGKLHGPMVEAVHSLFYLPKKELLSIIEYLKNTQKC
jgi:hypothetical protein